MSEQIEITVSAARLRRRLERMIEKTIGAEALRSPSWFIGDVAGERRALDDADAGRVSWAQARHHAKQGLDALDAGDPELAWRYCWEAIDEYVVALEARIRPAELKALGRSSGPRGRPSKKSP